MTINNIALFSDIHFGAKSNSETHNQDCLNYLDWFCDDVKKDPTIDAVGFLGDWNENRSSLNIQTLNYSYKGARKLNDLGLPVFFVIGNHDLYHRHTREVHSIVPFNEFTNFQVIDEPTVIDNNLWCPYMFHHEYPDLMQYLNIPVWFGHFEFKGYQVTGNGAQMPIGPDPADFAGPKRIFSGHFHTRQTKVGSNICYIGNTFPTNFGDAGDNTRGYAKYNLSSNKLSFVDWEQCPKYTKTTLTDILDNSVKLYTHSRVKCLVDVPITFEESTALKHSFKEKYDLREFTLEESLELKEALTDTTIDWDDAKLVGVDELVELMLNEIDSDHIDNQLLIDTYKDLVIP